MRKDESGDACPETLGEYRDLCAAIGGEACDAVKLLDNHIAAARKGREAVVQATDSQMRALLMPRLVPPRPTSEAPAIEASMGANHARAHGGTLSMWTVYEGPADYIGKYVARRWDISAGRMDRTDEVFIEDRIEPLRERFQAMGLCCLPPTAADDPVIVETWV